MDAHVQIGASSNLQLRHALLVYADQQRAFATLHDIIAQAEGAPLLAPAQPLTLAFLRRLAEGLGSQVAPEVLPDNVLARTPELIVWWSPAACRVMFFGEADEEARKLSGLKFPHPPLLFKVRGRELFVRALEKSARPWADTPLKAAPYWNTAGDDGRVCLGSTRVDMDAFFVSVEELEDPSLKGKAVIVGADPDGRGVVAAASYEARKFGVHSAQPIQQARKLCPHAIFLRGRHEKYREYSERISEIFSEFTPVVEMMSIDEAYLDLTGCERLHGSAFRAADRLIRRVKERTGLDCSIGVSTSHLVSKIASDQAKPHGLLYVPPGCEAKFLAPLPIRRMPGIGKVTEPELRALGIQTVGDLQRWSLDGLKQRFGRYGEWLHVKARGEDTGAYAYQEEPKSISHETTFDVDTADTDELERTLSYLAQLVARRLRDHGFFARTVGLKLRYADFRTLTRDVTLDEPTRLDSVIYENVLRLFERARNRRLKVRLVGVRASNLERAAFERNLFGAQQREKLDRLYEAADRVRDRFGFDAVQLARSIAPAPQPGAGPRRRKPRRQFLGRED